MRGSKVAFFLQTFDIINKTRLKMSNPYPHDVHIYLPNFKPKYVNTEQGECEIYQCVMNK